MTMIERVARAICRQANIDDGYGESKTLQASIDMGMWKNHVEQARVAIASMHDPTPAMIGAAIDQCDDLSGDAFAASERGTGLRAEWQAMIDAALAETK